MNSGMSTIVRIVAAILTIPIAVFGLYVILHGHLTPGGGFPGGAVLGTLTALFLVAFGKEGAKKIMQRESLSSGESIGLLLFAALAFLGIGATFFRNFLANSNWLFGLPAGFGPNPGHLNTAGLIPLMNLVVGLEVFTALSLIALLMFTFEGEGK